MYFGRSPGSLASDVCSNVSLTRWISFGLLTLLMVACGCAESPSNPTQAGLDSTAPLETCGTNTGNATRAGDAPLVVKVCVSSSLVEVGEELLVSVEAKDPDAPITKLTQCVPHTVSFGDEAEQCVEEAECAENGPGAGSEQWIPE